MKRLLILALCALLLLSGCTLAQPEGDASPGEDRLIGFLITEEPADGSIPADADVIRTGSDTQGRLWAEQTEETWQDSQGGTHVSVRVRFPEPCPGYACIPVYPLSDEPLNALGNPSGGPLRDVKFSDTETDEGRVLEVTGTLRIAADRSSVFRLNSIYQCPDGRVYAQADSSAVSPGSEAGTSFTVSLSQTSTWTENGSTEAYQASVSCTFAAFDVPESVVIRQVDAGGTALREDAYAPEETPESLTPEAGTAYLVVETQSAGGTVRQLVERGTSGFTTDIPCGSWLGLRTTEVLWPEA